MRRRRRVRALVQEGGCKWQTRLGCVLLSDQRWPLPANHSAGTAGDLIIALNLACTSPENISAVR